MLKVLRIERQPVPINQYEKKNSKFFKGSGFSTEIIDRFKKRVSPEYWTNYLNVLHYYSFKCQVYSIKTLR